MSRKRRSDLLQARGRNEDTRPRPTSSLMRVSTAALSISLMGALSWDMAAVSGASMLHIFDTSFCGSCRECRAVRLREPSCPYIVMLPPTVFLLGKL